MRIVANCHGHKFSICVGDGRQHIRWFGLVVAQKFQQKVYPHAFRIPQQISTVEGIPLRPRMSLNEELGDNDEVNVELREGATLPEELEQDEVSTWHEEAYGAEANLRIIKFQWKTNISVDMPIPQKVRGDYFIHATWLPVYPQKEYGGKFELPLDPVEMGDGSIEWVAVCRRPPGSANYRFILEDGTETICRGLPDHTMSADGTHHQETFPWEVPIASDPYPDADSRPSTASSVDGAEVDPRFDEDWDTLKLRWIEPHMKLRVKDVLKEFYGILIDLYDSYAFMGLDLAVEDPTTQSAHTIGLDDLVHLMYQANLVSKGTHVPKIPKGGAQFMPVPWNEIIRWYEETTQVRDGKPYLSQRLQRNHYLEMLLRLAHWVMCEHPAAQKMQQAVQMPLDEGLFRFLTDVLIPVMDQYDDDPLRKDAVQHENLVAIQRARPNLRSIFSFLAQHVDDTGENVLTQECITFVWQFGKQLLQEGSGAAPAGSEEDQYVQVFLQEVNKLGDGNLQIIIDHTESAIVTITKQHLEPDLKNLFFWEFFELIMHYSRHVFKLRGDNKNLGLHVVITQVVGTLSAIVKIIDARGLALPGEAE